MIFDVSMFFVIFIIISMIAPALICGLSFFKRKTLEFIKHPVKAYKSC